MLAFTTTARNSEVSLAVAVTAFASPLVALTVVIGPSIELPVLILMLRAVLAIREKGWFVIPAAPAAPATSAVPATSAAPAPTGVE